MDMDDKWWKPAVAGLLVVTLILSIVAMVQFHNIFVRLNMLEGSVYAAGSDPGYGAQLGQIQRAVSWYSPVEFKPVGSNEVCATVPYSLEWNFYELDTGMQVGLSYRVGEDGEWEEATVEETGPLAYRARVSLPSEEAYPRIGLDLIYADQRAQYLGVDREEPPRLAYVIHTSNTERERRSPVEYVQFPPSLPGIINVTIWEEEPGLKYHVVAEREPYDLPVPCSPIEKMAVFVEGSDGTSVEEEMPARSPDQSGSSRASWETTFALDEKLDITQLRVVATFVDGATVERSIMVGE